MISPAPRDMRPQADVQALPDLADTTEAYLESLQLLERMHRLMLDLVKDEFERLGQGELTPVQALLVYNLGDAEVTAGELRSRGRSAASTGIRATSAMGARQARNRKPATAPRRAPTRNAPNGCGRRSGSPSRPRRQTASG